MVLKAITERNDLLLRLNGFNMSTENLERRVWEENIVLKAKTASMKHFEKELGLSESAKRVL